MQISAWLSAALASAASLPAEALRNTAVSDIFDEEDSQDIHLASQLAPNMTASQPAANVTPPAALHAEHTGSEAMASVVQGFKGMPAAIVAKPRAVEEEAPSKDQRQVGHTHSVDSQVVSLLQAVAARRADVKAGGTADIVIFGLFMVASAFFWLRYWMSVSGDAAEKREQVREQRGQLLQSYNAQVVKVENLTAEAVSTTAHFAETCFEDKRKALDRFLKHARDIGHFFGPSDTKEHCLQAFQHFVACWSLLYMEHEVSDRLTKNIERPVAEQLEYRLNKFEHKTWAGVCYYPEGKAGGAVRFMQSMKSCQSALIFKPKHLEGSQASDSTCWVGLAASWGFGLSCNRAVEDQDSDGEEEGGLGYPIDVLCGCLRLTLLSRMHMFHLGTTFFGLGVAGFMVWRGLSTVDAGVRLMASATIIAEMLMIWLLCSFSDTDEVALIQRDIRKLENMSQSLQVEAERLDTFRQRTEHFHQAWTKRTIPLLDLFQQMHVQLEECPRAERLALLQGLNTRFQVLVLSLGDEVLWSGAGAVQKECLKFVTESVKSVTQVFNQPRGSEGLPDHLATGLLMRRMDRVFGFVVVKILGAKNIKHCGWDPTGLLNTSDPYVTISVPSGQQRRTATVKNDLNPTWGEEFFIPLHWKDNEFELHVWRERSLHHDGSLGSVKVQLSKLQAGHWHKRHDDLVNVEQRHMSKGAIDYQVYVGLKVDHFQHIQSYDFEAHADPSRTWSRARSQTQ